MHECIASLGMEQVLTAPQSPWQNPYAERLIGTIRRECLDHFVILNAKHLRRVLALYFGYYHASRTHLGLASNARFRARYQALEGLSKSRSSAVSITGINGSRPNSMPT